MQVHVGHRRRLYYFIMSCKVLCCLATGFAESSGVCVSIGMLSNHCGSVEETINDIPSCIHAYVIPTDVSLSIQMHFDNDSVECRWHVYGGPGSILTDRLPQAGIVNVTEVYRLSLSGVNVSCVIIMDQDQIVRTLRLVIEGIYMYLS